MTEQSASDRAQLLTDTFVLLSDTLVDDYDLVELLDHLVQSCVTLLDVTAAGLLLDDQQGGLALVASSNGESRVLELYQLQSHEGPCLECIRTGEPVTCGDLGAESARWPNFVSAALAGGFRSVAAVPLRLRGQTIGGLGLFDKHAREVSQADRALAQGLANVATIGILHRRSAHRSALLAEQLQHALDSRVVIEQAKGMLAERLGLSMEIAYQALRRLARERNLKLAEVSGGVLRGDLDLSAVSQG